MGSKPVKNIFFEIFGAKKKKRGKNREIISGKIGKTKFRWRYLIDLHQYFVDILAEISEILFPDPN